MMQETEVISCPACRHLLRVPMDWLGQDVQCPECKAKFKAPVKVGDKLTEPELMSRHEAAVEVPKKKFDRMLLIPAFGLLFCGIIGTIVNGVILSKLLFDRDGGREWATNQVIALRGVGIGNVPQPGAEEQQTEQDSNELLRLYRWFIPLSFLLSLGVLLGGLSIALRWSYWLAQLSCILAMLNIAHACCIPGAVAGLWGILMLNSEEGRQHFGK
jgi:hypothetical protein